MLHEVIKNAVMIKSPDRRQQTNMCDVILYKTADKSMQISKWLLMPCILVITALEMTGQETQKLKFGMVAGPQFSWFKSRSAELDGRGVAPGFQYGLFADFALKGNQRYYFSSGALIRHLYLPVAYNAAERVSGTLYASERTGNIAANYLYIPTALKMRTDEIGYSVFSGIFGFSTGIKLRGEERYSSEIFTFAGRTAGPSVKRDVSQQLQPVVLSFDIGIEWERRISGNTYFTAGIQFQNGLTNIFNMRSFQQTSGGLTELLLVTPALSGQGNFLKANPRSLSLNLGIYF